MIIIDIKYIITKYIRNDNKQKTNNENKNKQKNNNNNKNQAINCGARTCDSGL